MAKKKTNWGDVVYFSLMYFSASVILLTFLGVSLLGILSFIFWTNLFTDINKHAAFFSLRLGLILLIAVCIKWGYDEAR